MIYVFSIFLGVGRDTMLRSMLSQARMMEEIEEARAHAEKATLRWKIAPCIGWDINQHILTHLLILVFFEHDHELGYFGVLIILMELEFYYLAGD